MPSWFYGPDGQADIFDECPEGWADHPCKVKAQKPADVVKAVADMASQISAMDGDGDGRIGGSKPRARRGKKRG